jgi:hypothetical protein
MKKYFSALLLIYFSYDLMAQPYGNEWINYSQKYYYFKIWQKGVYRIDYNTLLNAGIPVNTINPRNIQIFAREQEQYIHIEGEQDNVFDPSDYIEFYAEGNDAWLDTLLYGSSDNMGNPYYSHYNDTLYYYITWNNSTNNRRMIIDNSNDYTNYSIFPYVITENYIQQTERYQQGELVVGSSSSRFVRGEGWFSDRYSHTSPLDHFIPTPNPYTGPGAPDALVKTSSTGLNNPSVAPASPGNHHLRIQYGLSHTTIIDTIFWGYQLNKINFTLTPSQINSPTTKIRYQTVNDILDINSQPVTQYKAFGVTSIRYARTTDLSGSSSLFFSVPFNTNESKTRLEFTNATGTNHHVYVINDTIRKIYVDENAGNRSVLIPNLSNTYDSRCYLFTESSITNISTLYSVSSTAEFTDYSAQPVDSAYIILTHTSLMSSAQAYANYRASTGYNVMLVNAEDLYHQYGGGIYKHVIALRRFCDHMINTMPTKPQYLFIIGKSIREANEGPEQGARKNSVFFHNNLVPSYGYPGSDNLITAGLDGSFLMPAIATGRISATTNQQVTDYLTKMQQYESQQNPFSVYDMPNKAWQKRILHFGGGSTLNEQNAFAGFLSTYETIAEGLHYGADVHTYLKQTSQPINPVDFTEISNFLQEGVSIMTFFGHSSANGFDQNLDDAANWNNAGKYPFLLGNGCYTGDVHQPTGQSISEYSTLLNQRGVIAFLSSVKQGFVTPLHVYSEQFYKEFSLYKYGLSVGKQMQATIDTVENFANSIPVENACTQMSLQGDPALKINYHTGPEMLIRNEDIYFTPEQVTLADDTITVTVVTHNIGKVENYPVNVTLTRTFQNNIDSVYSTTLNYSAFADTLIFKLPAQHDMASGLNTFKASIDIPNNINEIFDDVNNNQAQRTLLFAGNSIRPVWPYEYAIVPDSTMPLKASTSNPIIGPKAYRFEIDTTDLFNSPLLKYQLITAPGGVVVAQPQDWRLVSNNALSPLLFTDSTVYFWRVSPDSSTYIWQESSFQFIKGKNGWGQAHFFQFKNNYHENLNYNRTNRRWDWNPQLRKITCTTVGNPNSNPQMNGAPAFAATNYKIDNVEQEASGCGNFYPAIHVAVIDPISLEPWGSYNCNPNTGPCGSCTMVNSNHQFGNDNNDCSGCFAPFRIRPHKYFVYRQYDSQRLEYLDSLLTYWIPNGHYVLIYSWMWADFDNWNTYHPGLFTTFQNLGATDIVPGLPDLPFIVFAKKGDPSDTKTILGDSLNAILTLNDTLYSFDYKGYIKSVEAGPAAQWDALYFQQKSFEQPSADSSRIILIGRKLDGTTDTLLNTEFTTLDSVINLSLYADANIYPFVRLVGIHIDSVYFTPAQTLRWQLLYQPEPEAAVNGSKGFYISVLNNQLTEGQDIRLAIAIENISNWDMDSLLVHYWLQGQNNIKHYFYYPRQDSLKKGEILFDTITINTTGFYGLNSLWMEVNPIPLPPALNTTYYDQPEQYHFNNFAQIPLYIERDITNPILDVTFDGAHILNGDIVSAKPNILITLKDENPILVMNQPEDTAFFKVYITNPNGQQNRIYFMQGTQEIMRWYPSSGPNGKFKIEYNPVFLIDGKYRLEIEATDKSGNLSGNNRYKIDFEVINKPTVTEVMNYPNPFTTKTHFVFTLTGSQLPDFMKIQILTVTGKVVREITMDELGPIRIGRNVTQFYWDGTDMYGDRLANGVYLYRVNVRLNGEEIEKRSSGADEYFTKGYGKMYLMR